MEFRDYLKFMVVKDASDLFLTTGAPPTARIQGVMIDRTTVLPTYDFNRGEPRGQARRVRRSRPTSCRTAPAR